MEGSEYGYFDTEWSPCYSMTLMINTPHFRTYSRRMLFDLPLTLHGGRACRVHPKRCQPFFDPIHSFPAREQYADFWPLGKFKYRLTLLCGVLPVK